LVFSARTFLYANHAVRVNHWCCAVKRHSPTSGSYPLMLKNFVVVLAKAWRVPEDVAFRWLNLDHIGTEIPE
jgi:hypothetical protein